MLSVIKAGIETTLQDAGRAGLRTAGIPQSGAADRLSFAAANAALGNHWDAPALEIAMGGLSLLAQETMRLAISGADMSAQINGKALRRDAAFTLQTGETLSFGFAPIAARSYLAVSGGFNGEVFEGSRATYVPAGLGGIKGRVLIAGDILTGLGAPSPHSEMALPKDLRPRLSKTILLRVQKGPEFLSHVNGDSQRRFFTDRFVAAAQSNRMGARLAISGNSGAPLGLSDKTPLTSSPLLPGSLQITPDGTPILSGIDSHCTGGYVRALSVIAADHWLLGQIAPGSQIYFRRVTTRAALDALAQRNMIYRHYIAGFRFD
jgi:biotin-dependent carboxylase-like uncharacterized protein